MGALLGEPRGELLFGGSGRIWEEGAGMNIIHCGGHAGEICRVLIYWELEKSLEMGTFLHSGSVKNYGRSIHKEL